MSLSTLNPFHTRNLVKILFGYGFQYKDNELKSWEEHCLNFDKTVREENLERLKDFKDGDFIYLDFIESTFGNLTFEHWFITDGVNNFEFGSPNKDIYSSSVSINKDHYDSSNTQQAQIKNDFKKRMDKHVRARMSQLLGMCNYSLCLRNSEHVANYAFRGIWLSYQALFEHEKTGEFSDRPKQPPAIKQTFRNQMKLIRNKVNQFPAPITPHNLDDDKRLYSFITNNAIPRTISFYIDAYQQVNKINIVVIGPTGAGKSHIINILFNQKVVQSGTYHRSLTKDIFFIEGTYELHGESNELVETDIVVADTIGLCDTDWEEAKVIKLFKQRVSDNYKHIDVIMVVFPSDRLTNNVVCNLRKLMNLLHYDKYPGKFVFVGTRCENSEESDIERMKEEFVEMLDLRRVTLRSCDNINQLVYVGFPPEDALNETGKGRLISSWYRFTSAIISAVNFSKLYKDDSQQYCNIM